MLAEGSLSPMDRVKEGMLCVARWGLNHVAQYGGLLAIECYLFRSEDGCLYRARVVEVGKRTAVQFIDFGNFEIVETVYHYPTWLGLEMAPAAMEVELAGSLVSSTREEMEQVLMGEEGEKILEVQMEKEKVSGLHVARFFENGLEVSFCSKVEEALSNVV